MCPQHLLLGRQKPWWGLEVDFITSACVTQGGDVTETQVACDFPVAGWRAGSTSGHGLDLACSQLAGYPLHFLTQPEPQVDADNGVLQAQALSLHSPGQRCKCHPWDDSVKSA